MKNKLSEKDKKDWENFISSSDKLENKDYKKNKIKLKNKIVKKIDLHGLSLDDANTKVEKFIYKSFIDGVTKVVVITGKGLRSKNKSNPYVSEDLGILKYSIPAFINSKKYLIDMISKIEKADINDGGEGAFYIFLKKFKG